jgi:hypothetical protein
MFIRTFAIFLWVSLFATNCLAAPLRVTMLADEGPIFRDFSQALTAKINANQITLTVVPISAAIFPNNTDLVLAVGAQSTAIALNSRFKVLSVLVSKLAYEQMLRQLPVDTNPLIHSAIYLDQPYSRQLSLMTAALPKVRRVGVLCSSARIDVNALWQATQDKKVTLTLQENLSVDSLHNDLETVLKQSDVLLAVPDGQIFNGFTIRNILLETYRSRVPVIGFSASLVRAGALLAVFSTAEQLATQTVNVLGQINILSGLPRSQYPQQFDVLVNREVARSLNLALPETAKLHALISRGGAE